LDDVYSHSRLKCFDNCPKQFEFRYVLKIPQETEGIEAFVGKRVHEVLERLYEFVLRDQIPSLPKVLSRYEQLWDHEYDAERVRIVREGTPLSFYRQLGVRCLETYYRRNYPFDGDQTLGIEEHVKFDLDARDGASGQYRMQGFIDRVSLAKDGALEIHDYKTGNYVPSQKQLDVDPQLALYQIGVGNRYGAHKDVRLVWHYVARGIVRQSARTAEELQELREATMATIDRVRTATEFPTRKIPLCPWCEYKPQCPAWNREAAAPKPAQPATPEPASTAGPEQLSLLAAAVVGSSRTGSNS
jgi:putative RecB family exonuclease